MDQNAHVVKVSFIGPSGVGKTCLNGALLGNDYDESQTPTVAMNYTKKSGQYKGHNIDFNFWDTAGQDEYKNLLPVLIRNSQIVLLCFDPTMSWDENVADEYLSKISDFSDGATVLFILTKSDLWEGTPPACLSEMKNYASSHNFKTLEVSSLQKSNIEELFQLLLKISTDNRPPVNTAKTDIVKIDNNDDSKDAANFHKEDSCKC